MAKSHILKAVTAASIFALIACGQADDAQANTVEANTVEANAATIEPAKPAKDIAPVSIDAPSGIYVMEKTHAYITFSYDHQGYSRPWLRWRSFDAELNFDQETPMNSSIKLTIDSASIDSGVDIFDEHLRDPGFFDVEKYPTITFKSKSIDYTGARTGKLHGELTIKDMTKPVTLDVTFNKAGKARGSDTPKLGFSAKTTVQRNDFGSEIGKYVPFVGNDVDIVIEVEMVKKD